jgi:hypothetical protein
VCHEHQRRLGVRIQLEEQRAHALTGRRIEVAGRLIGEQHRGRCDKCAGERDTLLLSAGELARVMSFARRQSNAIESRERAAARIVRPASSRGSITFSSAVSAGTRWKA